MPEPNIEAFTLLSLAIVVIATRVGVRWSHVSPSNFQVDDYLMPLVGVMFALETVAAYLVGSVYGGLTNSYMTIEARAAIEPGSEEYLYRVAGSKMNVVGWSLYAAILWMVKFCLAFFYSRLTTGLIYLPIRVRISHALLGVTYTATALSLILGCQPMHKNWQINPDPGNLCQPAISKLNVLVVVIPNVLTDFYLMSIPLPLLWKVNIGLRRKITLTALFSGAVFVVLAAIIRAVTIIKAGPEGAISGSKWACRETFVAIVVSNLPIISPLIRKGASKIGLSGLFSSHSGPSHNYPLSSQTHPTCHERRSRPPHPLSLPMATTWGSDEHMLGEGENNGPNRSSKEITVVQETMVHSEPWPADQARPSEIAPEEWAHKSADHAK